MACPFCGSTKAKQAPVGYKLQCESCGRVFNKPPKRVKSKSRTTRARSSRQEKYNAKAVGGRVTANSGALGEKGDVRVPGLLRDENKTTKHRSFSLKLADLERIAAQAEGDEIPVLTICFEDDLRKQYRVISDAWFHQLLEAHRMQQEDQG